MADIAATDIAVPDVAATDIAVTDIAAATVAAAAAPVCRDANLDCTPAHPLADGHRF